MTRTNETVDVVVVEPDPERRERLRVAIASADGERLGARFVEGATAVADGETVPVAAVSLSVEDPVAEGRRLTRLNGARAIVFYGTTAEREEWSRRVSYDPLLPTARRMVDDEDPLVVTTLQQALARTRSRERGRAILARVARDREEASGFREVVDAVADVVLDALAPPGAVRDAYAAVLRGTLVDVARAEGGPPGALARAIERVLRRVELLRGREARERVAAGLARILDAAAGDAHEADVVVAGPEDLPSLGTSVRESGSAAGFAPPVAGAFAEAVTALVRAHLEEGPGPGVVASVRSRWGEIRVEWSLPDEGRTVTTTLVEQPAAMTGAAFG